MNQVSTEYSLTYKCINVILEVRFQHRLQAAHISGVPIAKIALSSMHFFTNKEFPHQNNERKNKK